MIGDAVLGKRLGRHALWIGALAQSLPDFDIVASLWSSSSEQLLTHRGWTHSLSFDLLASLLLALLFFRWYPGKADRRRWFLFFLLQVSIHLFLDFFNSYSIGLLEPFSSSRFSFPVLYVVDPFFSIGPAVAALVLLRPGSAQRVFWQRLGIGMAAAYLAYGWWHKWEAETQARAALRQQGIAYRDFRTIPTPFNHWLWYTVARGDSGFYINYHSVDDLEDEVFTFHPQNRQLLAQAPDRQELEHLLRFSENYYLLERRSDTLVFSDLRFGQIMGWEDARNPFIFQYYLGAGDAANRLALQRGRFSGWSGPHLRRFIRRIGGN